MKSRLPEKFPTTKELRHLIMETDSMVWKRNLAGPDIDRWLNNFTGKKLPMPDERRLALWLLGHFVYYNHEEVKHLCRVLLRRFIHDRVLDAVEPNGDSAIVDRVLEDTTFFPLGRPSESGGFVLYMFRQVNELNRSYFFPAAEVRHSPAKNLVFIDDVTLSEGSSSQALMYLQNHLRGVDMYRHRVFLLTFIATPGAVATLSQLGVTVVSAINLDSRNRFFETRSYVFDQHRELIGLSKDMAAYYGAQAYPRAPLGYSDGAYGFGFFYNTPDNALPIFWGTEGGWHPIFIRYKKNYSTRGLREYGTFI